MQFIQKGTNRFERAPPAELVNDRVEGVEIMPKIWVVVPGVMEYLKGEVEILLVSDDGREASGSEFLGPGFDGGSDCVRIEELRFGFD